MLTQKSLRLCVKAVRAAEPAQRQAYLGRLLGLHSEVISYYERDNLSRIITACVAACEGSFEAGLIAAAAESGYYIYGQ